ncbi:hypothetical protein OH77DRAFT_978378 [Trametes cingulata]|nr:hypothetical protein OH77DRAFT_978378 [Trametes cingulata]
MKVRLFCSASPPIPFRPGSSTLYTSGDSLPRLSSAHCGPHPALHSSPAKPTTSTSRHPPYPYLSSTSSLSLIVSAGLRCRALSSLLCFITFAFAFSPRIGLAVARVCIYAICCYSDSARKPHPTSPHRHPSYSTRLVLLMCVYHAHHRRAVLFRFARASELQGCDEFEL